VKCLGSGMCMLIAFFPFLEPLWRAVDPVT